MNKTVTLYMGACDKPYTSRLFPEAHLETDTPAQQTKQRQGPRWADGEDDGHAHLGGWATPLGWLPAQISESGSLLILEAITFWGGRFFSSTSSTWGFFIMTRSSFTHILKLLRYVNTISDLGNLSYPIGCYTVCIYITWPPRGRQACGFTSYPAHQT